MDSTQLYELEEAVQHFSDGLGAVKIMVIGLEQMKDANAGGLYAIWRYLNGVNQEVCKRLDVCMKTV